MNGPEHYREAERLLTGQKNLKISWPLVIAEAQVHATLALAAATAANIRKNGAVSAGTEAEWRETIGEPGRTAVQDFERVALQKQGPTYVLIGSQEEADMWRRSNPGVPHVVIERGRGVQGLRGRTGPLVIVHCVSTDAWPAAELMEIHRTVETVNLTTPASES